MSSRWKRIAVSAAGMLVEVFLACLALFGWWWTEPGPLHSIAMNVVLVCGVSTLLFNGNPLLKYDGYYILSDLMRMPNLWQESRGQASRLLGQWLLGRPAEEDYEPAGRRAFLVAYAAASFAYRLALTGVILLFLYRLLHPMGLDVLLLAVVLPLAGITLFQAGGSVARWARDPEATGRVSRGRMVGSGLLACLLIAAVVWWPVPCDVVAPTVLRPSDAEHVYVSTPGLLVEAMRPGQSVAAGGALARLENTELEEDLLRIDGERRRIDARVRTLETRLGSDAAVDSQLLVAREVLADLDEQLRLRRLERQSLTLRAPISGQVIPPPRVSDAADDDAELPEWAGTPVDQENIGSYLDRGGLFCLVGAPHRCEAVVYVDETEVSLIRVGNAARVRAAHAPAVALEGRVAEVAKLNASATPPELASLRDLETRSDRQGRGAPVRTVYQVRIELHQSDPLLLIGARGTARVRVAPQTVAQRVTRWLRRTLTL